MSQENVEAAQRAIDTFNRRDIEAHLAEIDPEAEFHIALFAMFGGESSVFRGHEGIRESWRDLDGTFAEFQIVEISEIRDLGQRVVAIGKLRARGKESGADVESPIGYVAEFKNGRMVRLDDYFSPEEALEAAGRSE
jgi:ketosteroid isomerase-like protein